MAKLRRGWLRLLFIVEFVVGAGGRSAGLRGSLRRELLLQLLLSVVEVVNDVCDVRHFLMREKFLRLFICLARNLLLMSLLGQLLSLVTLLHLLLL